ncbi:MAG: hypothetical protein Q8N69_03095, partial [bacterium]|nr:hypothetical protein [bacterium]
MDIFKNILGWKKAPAVKVNMPVFALQVLITNILFSWIILTAFMKLDRENMHSLPELMIYSLGFGPIGTSLLLYYLLLIVPHQSDLFYVLAVIVVYLFLFLLGRKNWSRALAEIVTMATKIKANYKTLNQLARMESIAVTGILLIALSIFFYVYFGYTLRLPLDESDALKYGEMGKICYQEKSLDYRWVRNDPETGFAPDFNSAPSFALLLTWEKMTGALFSSYQDIYFKSIGAYYALLILGILIFWLSKRNKLLAFLGVFAYLSGLYFFATLFEQHLDSYRIFFVIISWIWLAYAIDKNDRFSFVF